MKKRKMMVRKVAQDVRVVYQDVHKDYEVEECAEKMMRMLEDQVSPQLYGMLSQQLMAFHPDMQVEMAERLIDFAIMHVASTTGCPSADFILDVCYTWISQEHGIIKKGYRELFYNN